MKCLLHPFCVACKYDRVPTDYSSLNNFAKHCFLLNANYFQPVASGPIWTYWPTGTIHLNFHLFFNIYFGTTPGENHPLCLFTTLQFTKICAGAVSNNASLHIRKQSQRIEVTSYPGYTISRSWSPAQGFWFSRACSFVNSCVRWLKGLRRHGECPDFMNKRLYSLDPTFSSYSFITCPRSSNLLCGVADTQRASRSGRNTKATLGLVYLTAEATSFSDLGKTILLSFPRHTLSSPLCTVSFPASFPTIFLYWLNHPSCVCQSSWSQTTEAILAALKRKGKCEVGAGNAQNLQQEPMNEFEGNSRNNALHLSCGNVPECEFLASTFRRRDT